MLAIFQELNSKGPYLSSQKHKEYRCLVTTSSIKGESKEFHVVVEQWRQTWRNIRKSQSQLIAFLPFSLTPPPSTLRKLRNFYDWTSPPIAIHVHILRPRKHESGCAETEYLIFASTRIRCGVFTLDSPPLFQSSTRIHQTRRIQKKIHSAERCQKYAVSVCGFTDFVRTEGWRIRIKDRVCGFKNIRNRMERALYCHLLRRCFGRKSWKVKISSSLGARSCSRRCAHIRE